MISPRSRLLIASDIGDLDTVRQLLLAPSYSDREDAVLEREPTNQPTNNPPPKTKFMSMHATHSILDNNITATQTRENEREYN
jgi:hypothetical protein